MAVANLSQLLGRPSGLWTVFIAAPGASTRWAFRLGSFGPDREDAERAALEYLRNRPPWTYSGGYWYAIVPSDPAHDRSLNLPLPDEWVPEPGN